MAPHGLKCCQNLYDISPARIPRLDARKPCIASSCRGYPGHAADRGHGIAWRSAPGRVVRGDRSRDTSPEVVSPFGRSR